MEKKADGRGAAGDPARGSGAEKPSDLGYEAQNDQRGDVDALADTDDGYDVDDSDELSEDDFDGDDSDSDSYDVGTASHLAGLDIH